MPITKYTGANIKKLKKDELISHVIELYGFIDLFNNEEPKDREIAKLKEKNEELKEENEELKEIITEHEAHIEELEEDIEEHKEENKQLKTNILSKQNKLKDEITKFKKELKEEDIEEHKDDKELIKLKNDNEIVKMMFIDEFVRDEIEKTIDEGIDQYTFNIGTGYYKEHKLKYVKDIIMPHLTTYHNGDSQCSSYQNGKFYYKMDCMMPYDIDTDNDGTYTFNRIDDDY
tara:strand:+ start:655 stop:1347 length:693 start_codon:yes stop_codon:yes gene_type:complete